MPRDQYAALRAADAALRNSEGAWAGVVAAQQLVEAWLATGSGLLPPAPPAEWAYGPITYPKYLDLSMRDRNRVALREETEGRFSFLGTIVNSEVAEKIIKFRKDSMRLEKIRAAVKAHDDKLNDNNEPPTGDDYNDIVSIIMED